jgi:signal transduction histidine kinase
MVTADPAEKRMQETVKQWSYRTVLAGTFILSALPLLIVEIFPGQLKFTMAPASYLVFHNIAEFFSVMVSLSMFGVGWYTFDQSNDRHALFLSTAFLAIGLMDFMHALGNAAMPAFITPNSSNKSTQFWIAGRLFQAVAFLVSAYVYPDRPRRWLSKRILMVTALVVPLLVFTGITFFASYMPATFVPGVGLTFFKKFSEYLVMLLLCATTAAYWRRMSRTGDRLLIYYLAAFIICIFSELPFAVYTRVFDTYNVLGHIYKVAAFFLIYYGIYKASVRDPYIKLEEIGEELRRDVAERKRTEEALKVTSEALREREKRLSDLSARLLKAHEEERKRIAGELHDTLGSCLSGIKFKVENALPQVGKAANVATESLSSIIPVIQEGIDECRRMQMDLRPPMLDDLGLLATLSWFCRRFQTIYSTIQIKQEIGIEEAEIPNALKIVIYRITQEAMNNIAKHSKADFVRLSLRKLDNKLELVIQDNGKGFNIQRGSSQEGSMRGLGLTSMKERTELSGGSLTMESAEGKGAIICASWPLWESGQR